MQGSDSFRLVVRRGPQPNQVYDLNKDIITLGRDITNDITINDPEVSRHHLRLTRGAGGFTIEDLGSTNGTFINGQRLTGARPLNMGDMIGLGETVTLGYEVARGQPLMGGAPEVQPTMPGPTAAPPPNPYAPPAQQQPYGSQPPPPQQQYAPPAQQQVYGQQPPPPQQQYAPPPAPYGAAQSPPAAGYEYDPYAIREEEPRSAARWIIIGCVVIALFCVCSVIIGLVIIDTLNIWCDVPIVNSIVRALGLASCGAG